MLSGKESAVLFELRGDRPGSAHLVKGNVFRIGSDTENDLLLRDRDIALYQAEIRLIQGQFILKNLAREVPVFLNGETFDVATLHKGDIVTIGQAMFRFIEFGETLKKTDLWQAVGGAETGRRALRPNLYRRFSFLTVLSMVAVLVVALFLWRMSRPPETRTPGGREPSGTQDAARISEIRVLYDRGVDLVVARRWDEAVVVFEDIQRDLPNYKDTDKLYQEALLESTSLDALNQGKGLYAEGALEEAKGHLETIGERSLYSREAGQLIREINSRMVAEKIGEAEESLRQRDWAAARGKAKAILFLSPNERRAVDILQESDRMKGAQPEPVPTHGPPTVVQQPTVISGGRASAARGMVGAAKMPRRGSPDWHVYRAVSMYRKGDPVRSMEMLRPVISAPTASSSSMAQKATEIRNNLLMAKTYFDQAKQLQAKRNYAEAVEMWERFLERDRKISGSGSGVLFLEASAHLSSIYYERGKREYDRGNLGEAFLYWNMAEQIHEKDPEVQEGLQRLARSAQEFYREGYSLYDYNPKQALKKWKEVLQIVPEKHPYYRKAQDRVEKGLQEEVGLSPADGPTGMTTDRESAQQFFREGYCIQDINPERAIERWLEIVENASPSDPYYHKAKKELDRNGLSP
jgi:tetratricopeptide (TPR) repeat protein